MIVSFCLATPPEGHDVQINSSRKRVWEKARSKFSGKLKVTPEAEDLVEKSARHLREAAERRKGLYEDINDRKLKAAVASE